MDLLISLSSDRNLKLVCLRFSWKGAPFTKDHRIFGSDNCTIISTCINLFKIIERDMITSINTTTINTAIFRISTQFYKRETSFNIHRSNNSLK